MFDGFALPSLRSTRPARLELDPLDGINRGLVGFWPLNESGGGIAEDIGPYRMRGALHNTPTRILSPKLGRVMQFAGGGGAGVQNINLGTMRAFASQQSPISISAWVYPTDLSGNHTIFSQYLYYGGGGEMGKLLVTVGSSLYWGCNTASGAYQLLAGPTLTLNAWQHVGISVSGPTSAPIATLWVDNVSTTSALSATGVPRLDVNHRIGASDFALLGGSEGWTGYIGPVRAWARGISHSERVRISNNAYAGAVDTADRLFVAFKASGAPPVTSTLTCTIPVTGSLTGVSGVLGTIAGTIPVTGSIIAGGTVGGISRTRRGARRIYMPEPEEMKIILPASLAQELPNAVYDDDEDAWILLG